MIVIGGPHNVLSLRGGVEHATRLTGRGTGSFVPLGPLPDIPLTSGCTVPGEGWAVGHPGGTCRGLFRPTRCGRHAGGEPSLLVLDAGSPRMPGEPADQLGRGVEIPNVGATSRSLCWSDLHLMTDGDGPTQKSTFEPAGPLLEPGLGIIGGARCSRLCLMRELRPAAVQRADPPRPRRAAPAPLPDLLDGGFTAPAHRGSAADSSSAREVRSSDWRPAREQHPGRPARPWEEAAVGVHVGQHHE